MVQTRSKTALAKAALPAISSDAIPSTSATTAPTETPLSIPTSDSEVRLVIKLTIPPKLRVKLDKEARACEDKAAAEQSEIKAPAAEPLTPKLPAPSPAAASAATAPIPDRPVAKPKGPRPVAGSARAKIAASRTMATTTILAADPPVGKSKGARSGGRKEAKDDGSQASTATATATATPDATAPGGSGADVAKSTATALLGAKDGEAHIDVSDTTKIATGSDGSGAGPALAGPSTANPKAGKKQALHRPAPPEPTRRSARLAQNLGASSSGQPENTEKKWKPLGPIPLEMRYTRARVALREAVVGLAHERDFFRYLSFQESRAKNIPLKNGDGAELSVEFLKQAGDPKLDRARAEVDLVDRLLDEALARGETWETSYPAWVAEQMAEAESVLPPRLRKRKFFTSAVVEEDSAKSGPKACGGGDAVAVSRMDAPLEDVLNSPPKRRRVVSET